MQARVKTDMQTQSAAQLAQMQAGLDASLKLLRAAQCQLGTCSSPQGLQILCKRSEFLRVRYAMSIPAAMLPAGCEQGLLVLYSANMPDIVCRNLNISQHSQVSSIRAMPHNHLNCNNKCRT